MEVDELETLFGVLFDRNLRYSTVNHKRRLNPFPHNSFSMAECRVTTHRMR